jgi:thioredoxin 1
LAEFNKTLSSAGDKLVVVDFFADWCPPCKRIAPRFVELAAENKDTVFVKVNVDTNKVTS